MYPMEGALRCVHMDTNTDMETADPALVVGEALAVTSRGGGPPSDSSGRASAADRGAEAPSEADEAAEAAAGDGRGAEMCAPRSWRC